MAAATLVDAVADDDALRTKIESAVERAGAGIPRAAVIFAGRNLHAEAQRRAALEALVRDVRQEEAPPLLRLLDRAAAAQEGELDRVLRGAGAVERGNFLARGVAELLREGRGDMVLAHDPVALVGRDQAAHLLAQTVARHAKEENTAVARIRPVLEASLRARYVPETLRLHLWCAALLGASEVEECGQTLVQEGARGQEQLPNLARAREADPVEAEYWGGVALAPEEDGVDSRAAHAEHRRAVLRRVVEDVRVWRPRQLLTRLALFAQPVLLAVRASGRTDWAAGEERATVTALTSAAARTWAVAEHVHLMWQLLRRTEEALSAALIADEARAAAVRSIAWEWLQCGLVGVLRRRSVCYLWDQAACFGVRAVAAAVAAVLVALRAPLLARPDDCARVMRAAPGTLTLRAVREAFVRTVAGLEHADADERDESGDV